MSASAPLRVEALVSGRLAASSRFRVLQHVAPLHRLGIEVRADPPRISKYASVPDTLRRYRRLTPLARRGLLAAKVAVRLPHLVRSWWADLTWLEREIIPEALTLEPFLHRPLLFDVDDAIWLLSEGHERAVRAIAAHSSCVVAGNDFLAEWFSSVAPEVERVWTAVDTDRFKPAPPHDRFVVGWAGSASTLGYLGAVSRPLGRFLAATPEARFQVLADFAPRLPHIPPERVEFIPWSPGVETDFMQQLSVGIMPLPDTDWGRGKCAFKMLQYLSCGVPAVVSPVGMGAQVLAMADVGLAACTEDDWLDALLALYGDRDHAQRLGIRGRALVEERFSVAVISDQLGSCMRRHAR